MEDSTIRFSCPSCGNQSFKLGAEPRSISEFNGAICANCCHALTEDDIKARAIEIAREGLLKALKR